MLYQLSYRVVAAFSHSYVRQGKRTPPDVPEKRARKPASSVLKVGRTDGVVAVEHAQGRYLPSEGRAGTGPHPPRCAGRMSLSGVVLRADR